MKNTTLPARFVQKKFLIGRREFTFLNESILKVFVKERGMLDEYEVELSVIDPSPNRRKQTPRSKWVQFGILFMCLSFLTYKAITNQDEVAFIGMFLGVAILAPVSYYLWVNGKQGYDWLIFFNKFSGEPVLYFHHNLPNEHDFATFINEFMKRIKAKQSGQVEESQVFENSIGQQIQEFAKLKKQGALTEEEFIEAKKTLLKQLKDSASATKIGF